MQNESDCNTDALVSVIIPIYNVSQYLDRCIKSILNQTYKNLDIILVDDGSTDSSPDKCDKWLSKDTRIKVIHKNNGGLSDARNVGLEASIGNWIVFIDSDDYVMPEMIQKLLDAVKKNKADIAICSYFLDYGTEKKSINPIFKKKSCFSRDAIILKYFLYKPGELVVAWNKLYKRNLFFEEGGNHKKNFYPIGRLYEDEYTTYKLLYKANKIAWVPDELYAYVQRESVIMHTNKPSNILDIINIIYDYDIWADNTNKSLSPVIISAQGRMCLSLLRRFIREPYLDPTGEYNKIVQNILRDKYNELISNSYVKPKEKIKYFLFNIGILIPFKKIFHKNKNRSSSCL